MLGLEAVNQLAAACVRAGFRRRFKSESGTVYLYLPGYPYELRIADHKWSNWSKRRQCQVISSRVITQIKHTELNKEATRLKAHFLERVQQQHDLARVS